MYPESFRKLIELLEGLPYIGSKTAERLASFIFSMPPSEKENLAKAILKISDLKECKRCFNISDDSLCRLCKDSKRNQKVIAIVENPLHIGPFEKAGYRGSYFVLGGLISSLLEEPRRIRIKELLNRIKKEKPKEIIMALNPSLEGDTTSIYIARKIKKFFKNKVKISRLAQGLPTGAVLEYADELTIKEALRGRRRF